MNKELIKNELQWLLEAINEQYDAIQGYNDKIPHIEFDILMENVRKFYENMLLLQRLNDPLFAFEKIVKPRDIRTFQQPEAAHSERVKETSLREKKVPDPSVESIPHVHESIARPDFPETRPFVEQVTPVAEPVNKPVVPAAEPVNKQSVQVAEPVYKPVESGITAKFEQPAPFKPAGPVRHEPPAVPKKPARSLEIDLFAAEEPTFSIKLKDAREKTFSPKIPSERIDNLKSAISINEKFIFINELFEGNLREYNETIETLNGFKNLEQAADFLDLMRKKNFWDTGSNAFKKLKELVERRF